MKTNKSAFVVGWHAHQNTGDNAMLQVISWFLNKYFNIENIYLLGTQDTIPKMDMKFTVLKPVFWITDRVYFLKKLFYSYTIAKSDALVFGGGSIFHSDNSIKWKLWILLKFKRKKPYGKSIAMGISIGPFSSEKGKKLFLDFASNLDMVIVRDKHSRKFMQDNGLGYKVILLYDLAFYMPNICDFKVDRIKNNNSMKIGVSLRFFLNNESLNNRMIDLIDSISKISDTKIEISFFAFAKEDELFFPLLKKRLKISNLNFYKYYDKPISFLEIMKECNTFIGMRFHSQIYSTILGLPLILLDYHQKCSDFAEDMNIPSNQIFNILNIDIKQFLNTLRTINYLADTEYISQNDLSHSISKLDEKMQILLHNEDIL